MRKSRYLMGEVGSLFGEGINIILLIWEKAMHQAKRKYWDFWYGKQLSWPGPLSRAVGAFWYLRVFLHPQQKGNNC